MDKIERVNTFADASYRATVTTRDFVEAEVVPVIHAQVAASPFEEAIMGLFYRLVLWGRTLAELGHTNHLQAVRSGARAAFELHLDIHHVASDPTVAAKMFAFTKVWKYSSALKMVNFLKDHPEISDPVFRHQQALVDKGAIPKSGYAAGR